MQNQIVKTENQETDRLLTDTEEHQEINLRRSPQEILEQVNAIKAVMKEAMQKGEHYDVIPGCSTKPTLLKAGIEKLCMMFRLAPSYQIKEKQQQNDHREYEILATLHHIDTGKKWGEGVGCCSTMESKYRYRWDSTGRPVPQEYWGSRDPAILGGHQFKARKVANEWLIFQYKEHDNPADYYNTVLKMAKMRAFRDVTITATSASDCFSQDLEDLVENGVINGETKNNNKPDNRNYQHYQKNKPKQQFPELITKIQELCKQKVISSAQMEKWLKKGNATNIEDLKMETLQAIVDKYAVKPQPKPIVQQPVEQQQEEFSDVPF